MIQPSNPRNIAFDFSWLTCGVQHRNRWVSIGPLHEFYISGCQWQNADRQIIWSAAAVTSLLTQSKKRLLLQSWCFRSMTRLVRAVVRLQIIAYQLFNVGGKLEESQKAPFTYEQKHSKFEDVHHPTRAKMTKMVTMHKTRTRAQPQ